MPDEQINHLVDYLMTLKGKPEAAAKPPAAPAHQRYRM